MDQVSLARFIARNGHEGQTDYSGAAYIEHVERIAARVRYDRALGQDHETVAWLHDVVEDTKYTLEHLARLGFSLRVITAVDAISHRKGESNLDYIDRAMADDLAAAVKLHDLNDHVERMDRVMDLEVRDRLTRKYDKIFAHIEAHHRERITA